MSGSSPQETTPYQPLDTAAASADHDDEEIEVVIGPHGMGKVWHDCKERALGTPGRRIFLCLISFAVFMVCVVVSLVVISRRINSLKYLLAVDSTNFILIASGANVSYAFSATAGTAPYTFYSDGLPPGLELLTNGSLTGILSCSAGKVEQYRALIIVEDAVKDQTRKDYTIVCTGQGVGTLLHISDVHLTKLYSSAQNRKVWCVPPAKNKDDPSNPLYTYGQYGCDSPKQLVESMAYALTSFYGTPVESLLDLVMLSGDMAGHGQSSTAGALSEVRQVKEILDDALSPGTRVATALGNNDVWPNYQAQDFSGLAQALSRDPAWLNEAQAETFVNGGYYSAMLSNASQNKLLVINTVYYSTKCMTTDGDDPGGQLSWLSQELAAAKTKGYKVYLLAHIPPGQAIREGTPLWEANYTESFLKLVESYQDVIVAAFMGHEHTDEFRLFNSQSFLVLENAAVSPVYDDNPTFRVLLYDRRSLSLLDWYNLYTDLAQQTQAQFGLIWSLEYGATSAYGLDSVNPSTMKKLQTELQDQSELYTMYAVTYSDVLHTVRTDPDPAYVLCSMVHADKSDFDACVDSMKGR